MRGSFVLYPIYDFCYRDGSGNSVGGVVDPDRGGLIMRLGMDHPCHDEPIKKQIG